MNLDFIRTSASRPELLKKSTNSIFKNLKFSGEIRFLLHEDFLNFNASIKCREFAIQSNVFDRILTDDPAIGQGKSIDRLYRLVQTEYFIHWEDDFELIRELNLDDCVKILNENKGVNQIAFNKRATMSTIGEPIPWVKKQVERSGFQLVTSPHWRLTPAIWRKSLIDRFWNFQEETLSARNFNWLLNDIIKNQKTESSLKNADWIIKNVGCYYLGKIDERQYVNHIGTAKSLRENQYKWE